MQFDRERWQDITRSLLILAILLVVVLAGYLANGKLRLVAGQAMNQLTPTSVAAVVPVQLVAIGLCALAMRCQKSGLTLWALFVSRLLRDAGNNMLLIFPGLGEVIGARVILLAGGRMRSVIAMRGFDIAAETLGQVPYFVIAALLIARSWREGGLLRTSGAGAILSADVLLGLMLIAIVVWQWPAASRLRARLARARAARHLIVQARLVSRETKRSRGAMPWAILIHAAAWGLSGVQIWLAARAIGAPIGMMAAIAIESAASAARVILFFLPGGLIAQEAGIVAAGLALGVPAPTSLTIALVLRVRDLVMGSALLAWPMIEGFAHRTQRRNVAA